MEKELELAGSKKETLGRTCELVHAQANSILLFTLQWNDLEEHFDKMMRCVEEKSVEVEKKMELLDEREKAVGLRESAVDGKVKELGLIRESIDECGCDLEKRRGELCLVEEIVERLKMERESLEDGIRVCDEKLELKKSKLSEIEKMIVLKREEFCVEADSYKTLIEEYKEELEVKESDFREVVKSIEARREEVKFKEDQLVKLNLEQKRLESVEKEVQCRVDEEEVKLKAKRKKVKKCSGKIEMMKSEFKCLCERTNEQAQELSVKMEELDLLQQALEKSNKELKEKEEMIILSEKSLANCSEELEMKKEQLSSVEQSVQELTDERLSQELELSFVKSMRSQYLEEIKEKEQQFNSMRSSLAELSKKLEVKEARFEESLKEFELKKAQSQKTIEEQQQKLEMLEKQLVNEGATMLHSHLRSCSPGDGKELQLHMNENLKRNELFLIEMSNAIKKAHDPAKLVLDAVDSFFPALSHGEEVGFEVVRNRKSCLLLLENLLSFSPQISPQVQDEALKLAGLWKSKIAEDNSVEVLGFLHLVAAFRLVSDFDGNEVQRLLDIVDPYKQKPELINALKMPDESRERSIFPTQVKTEQVEHTITEMDAPSEISIQDSIREEEGNADANDLPDEFSAALQVSPDPAKFALDFIQNTYSRNQKKGNAFMKEGDIRFYILILEQLRLILPKISPQVKAQATKLAVEWKSHLSMVKENSFMVLLFLLFVATYELGACFGRIELSVLVFVVSQHKQAPGLCRSLGFINMVPDIIPSLIGRHHYLEAVRFICSFKLMDKFSPKAVIKMYLAYVQTTSSNMNKEGSNGLETKHKALDFSIAALRALIECIEECKLESSISIKDIKNCILNLEADKEISSHSLPMITHQLQDSFVSSASSNQPPFDSAIQPRPFHGQNCNFNTPNPKFHNENHISRPSSSENQQNQWNSQKRPRTDSFLSPISGAPMYQSVTLQGIVPTNREQPSVQYPTLLSPQEQIARNPYLFQYKQN